MDEKTLMTIPLSQLLIIIETLLKEVERQREATELWTGTSEIVEERLRLELRILHAIIEQDELLQLFQKARRELMD